MKTLYPYHAAPIQVPDQELRHLGKDQTTIQVRGFAMIYAVQNADGSYAGFIRIADAEKCKEGLCNPRNH